MNTLKTVDEIFREMLEAFALETGLRLNETGEMAVRLYALAAQIYGLYLQNQWTLSQCFPQTAQGDYLDKHATLRGLSRSGTEQAAGTIRFFVETAGDETLPIPRGTVCLTAGLTRFETVAEGSLPAGALYVDVPARALEVGTGGNVPAGTIRSMAVSPVGIAGCTNPAPFLGGVEAEEDESLRARVLETYARMPNGANAAYYQREALSFSSVAAVNVLGKSRGVGTVDVVIAEAGGSPAPALLNQVEGHLAACRDIAVDLKVKAPTLAPFALTVQVKAKEGAAFSAVKAQVERLLLDHFDGRQLGCPVLHAQLGQMIYGVPGVLNYRITAPAADIPGVPGVLPRLTALTVEAMV